MKLNELESMGLTPINNEELRAIQGGLLISGVWGGVWKVMLTVAGEIADGLQGVVDGFNQATGQN